MQSVTQRTSAHACQPLSAPSGGLAFARPGGYAALTDAHFVIAFAVAVPVWLMLGLVVGANMQVLVGWQAWISGVLVLPLLEEWVFRGLLQGQLLRLLKGRRLGCVSWANWCVSGAFVAVHFMTQPAAWALAVALPSLVLGHLRERLGSAWPGVLVHAYFNAGFWLTACWVGK